MVEKLSDKRSLKFLSVRGNRILGVIFLFISIYFFIASMVPRGMVTCDHGFKNCVEIKHLLPENLYRYVILMVATIFVMLGYTLIRRRQK